MSETCEIREPVVMFREDETANVSFRPCGKPSVGVCDSGLRICIEHQQRILDLERDMREGTVGIRRGKIAL